LTPARREKVMSDRLFLNDRIRMAGFVTKAAFLRGLGAEEIERRLGYAHGRLASGYWLLFLEQTPSPDEFEFMGYSQMSGGAPQGHLNPLGGQTAEQSLRAGGFDLLRLKQKVIRETFRISGPQRLAKVLPIDPARGPTPYPPGSGVPQWRLLEPGLPFRVAQQIQAGRIYSGDDN
jgi:hypothetical protein